MQLRSSLSTPKLTSGDKSSTAVKDSPPDQSPPASRTASKNDVAVADVAVVQESQDASNSEIEALCRPVTRSVTAEARKMAAASIPPGSLQEQAEEDEYEVEKILAKYVDKDGLFYFIKWAGYSNKVNTWEPLHNLTKCLDLVEEFERNMKEMEEQVGSSLGCKRSRDVDEDWDEDDSGESKKRNKF